MTESPTDAGIFVAALQGDLQTLRKHAQHVNSKTPEGYTPLSLCVSAGHTGCSAFLLREGAVADAADNGGTTGASHAKHPRPSPRTRRVCVVATTGSA